MEAWGATYERHAAHSQCRGVTRSTGERCKVRWNLSADGYCQHHQPRQRRACGATTKLGTACRIRENLDHLGFCRYHTPEAAQCLGVARSTSQRCQIRWDISPEGYCKYHQPTARCCTAVALTTGRRCRVSHGLDADGRCAMHSQQLSAASERGCRKRIVVDGVEKLCGKTPKHSDYDFCCAGHDESLRLKRFASTFFGEHISRQDVADELVARFGIKDRYHGDQLDMVTSGAVEVDHILEKQCLAFVFQLRGEKKKFSKADRDHAAGILRTSFTNSWENICLTRTTTNKIKGAAVYRFLDDCLTGHLGRRKGYPEDGRSLQVYLSQERRDGMRLSRKIVRTIVREMWNAVQVCDSRLKAASDAEVVAAVRRGLASLVQLMGLNGKSLPVMLENDICETKDGCSPSRPELAAKAEESSPDCLVSMKNELSKGEEVSESTKTSHDASTKDKVDSKAIKATKEEQSLVEKTSESSKSPSVGIGGNDAEAETPHEDNEWVHVEDKV
ncbi:hypothetical protein P43SY_007637 [Pythium insidiosum]|uniref:Uncharacterized protein n=1 Tax=Pythium insidiosum TaxID=114742 RepID=A0AAD5Q750_PYTIN|nr:hypothetical protein P43SY_007637 [Pythium insidiosum]